MTGVQPFRLGDWLVLPLEDRLEGPGGEEVHLEPRLMDVLVHLASRPGVVISPRRAINRLWHGHGNVAAFAHAICDLRRRIGDDARAPSYIETIPKRGYRLIAPVHSAPEAAAGSAAPADRAASNAPPRALSRWSALLVDLRRRKVFRAITGYLLVAWLTVQIAEVTFEPLRLPDWALTFVVVLAILGLPVTALLSWTFELTPRGMTRDAFTSSRRAAAAIRASGSLRVAPTLFVVVVVAGVLLVSSFALDPTLPGEAGAETAPAQAAPPDGPAGVLPVAIGVVPFDVASSDTLARQLGRNVGRELRLHLQQVGGIRLVSAAGRQADAAAGVDFLIDGSVTPREAGFRITVRILATPSGELRWSDSFDVAAAALGGSRSVPAIARQVAIELIEAIDAPAAIAYRTPG